MSVAFFRGQQLGNEDLNIYLENNSGYPVNAAEIYYALYDFTTGEEVLLGAPKRTPANSSVGCYYASIIVPLDANIGSYRIRWTFRETLGGALHQVVQEFEVIDKATSSTSIYSCCEEEMIRRLRILLRDQNPDRNYHFRPPAHETTIQQFNQVFGYIWENDELQEYLLRSLDMISASPPRTPFTSCDQLVQVYPEWRTLLLNGAMMHALLAVMINWIADEFSVAPDTKVTLGLADGRRISLTISELFEVVQGDGKTRKDIRKAFREGTLVVQSVQSTGEVGWFPVADVLKHEVSHKCAVRVTLEDGREVTTTEDHSLFVGLSPVEAGSLLIGSVLTVVLDGKVSSCRVVSIESAPSGTMYDLSVPGPQNFVLTNGILAHNSYSIGGVSLDIEKSSKYESAYQAMNDQFDKQLERAKNTVKIVKGLQQPRYGVGIRSAFGPYVGAGVLSPRKFVGL